MSPAVRVDDVPAPPAVLLVEDETVVRALLAEEMRAAGWLVVEAATADEAWAFLEAGGSADLLFSDVTMPGSMDGIGLMERVRASFPEMKVVITSGNLGPRCVRAFDRFMQKPYSFDEAVDAAAALLGVPVPVDR
jgi:CheY-like chemotaxis protein